MRGVVWGVTWELRFEPWPLGGLWGTELSRPVLAVLSDELVQRTDLCSREEMEATHQPPCVWPFRVAQVGHALSCVCLGGVLSSGLREPPHRERGPRPVPPPYSFGV